MIAPSARFREAIRYSHRAVIEVVAMADGSVVSDPLAVVGGSVTMDATAASMRRLSVDLAEPLRVPADADDVLSPFGFELRVKRGIMFPDGTVELMPLGVFPIQSSDVTSDGLVVKIDGLDRSQRVRDARLMDAYAVPANTNYGQAIRDLIDAGVPGLTYAFASVHDLSPALQFSAQADRWELAQTMAGACGMNLFFDGEGVLTLRPRMAASTTPEWTVSDGPGGVLVSASSKLDRGPAYNGVVASSSMPGATTTYRSVALDLDPSSPTYWDGRFGRKPMFFTSPLITSQEMCDRAAATILGTQIGVAKSVAFDTWADPSREPGISALVHDARLGLDGVHVVDSLTMPLTAKGRMRAQTRLVAA